jgi:N2-acetyl-L-2,4-diaminobutanoate deacetylase
MKTNPDPWQRVEPGSVWRGWWQSGYADLPPLPVLCAQGVYPGPTLLVTGAVHGDEYEGPAAIARFMDQLDLAQLRGRVIGLPVVNGNAWRARSRCTPSDGGDLNRAFGGQQEGETARLAAVIYETFVRACDLLVDLHSGGARLVHLPMVGWYQGAGRDAEILARRFGAPVHPWRIPDVPGVLSYEAHRLGKVALGAEWRGGAALDPAGVEAYTAGLQRLWAIFTGVVEEGQLAEDPRDPIAGSYQTTEQGGLFLPHVRLGERVEAGAVLGLLSNELGEAIATPAAFRSGVVAALPHLALLFPGDRIAYIG